MKAFIKYSLLLFLGLVSINGISQPASYIISDSPSVFKKIEALIIEDDLIEVQKKCEQILKSDDDPLIRGLANYYKGICSMRLNKISSAANALLSAKNTFKSIEHIEGLAKVFNSLAELNFNLHQFEASDTLYDKAIFHARNQGLSEILSITFQKKADISTINKDYEKAIVYLKQAYFYSDETTDKQVRKLLINQLATSFHANGQLDSAILYFNKGITLKTKLEDIDGLIGDHTTLGNLLKERGAFETAQKHLISALELAEKEEDTISMMTIYKEIGDVFATQKNWGSAEKNYRLSLDIAQKKERKYFEAENLKKMGLMFDQQKLFKQSTSYLTNALEIFEALNNSTQSAETIIALSNIYNEKEHFNKAKTLLRRALKMQSESQDIIGILQIKMSLAEIEINQGNISEGIKLAEECFKSYEEMNNSSGLRKSYHLLSQAYAARNNFKKAYQFQNKYLRLNDSLTSIQRSKVINELEMRYSTEKKDKEIALQKVALEKQEVQIQKRNNQLIMLIAGISLLGLLAALLYFFYRKNKQLNQQRIQVLKKEQETLQLKAVIRGEEKERKRVASELHDGLGAVLATVKMTISNLQHKMPQVLEIPTYQKAESLIDDACKTVREISHNLTPHVVENEGLQFAIEDLCTTIAQNNDLIIQFIPFGELEKLEKETQSTLYRIIQELLKNILKHAEADEVIVQLSIEASEIILIVEDDGKGFKTKENESGIGLENIKLRTEYLGGTYDIDSRIGVGSTFTFQFPHNL